MVLLGVPALSIMSTGKKALKFEDQLAIARHQRSMLANDATADEILINAGLTTEHTLAIDNRQYAFAAALCTTLDFHGELHQLHMSLADFSPSASRHTHVMHQKKKTLAPLANPDRAEGLLMLYDALVCEVIAPHIAANVHGTTSMYYAAFPTIRVQHPSELSTIRPHVDGMYALQPGSINFWLPLTAPLDSSASLHVESAPEREDFHPLLPDVTAPVGSTLFCFHGRRCVHYTVPNTSEHTRVSLDFRAVPGTLFDHENRLSRAQYYSMAMLSPSGVFEKCSMGAVTYLHGLPHERRPGRRRTASNALWPV